MAIITRAANTLELPKILRVDKTPESAGWWGYWEPGHVFYLGADSQGFMRGEAFKIKEMFDDHLTAVPLTHWGPEQ
jgi:hypothetical protein